MGQQERNDTSTSGRQSGVPGEDPEPDPMIEDLVAEDLVADDLVAEDPPTRDFPEVPTRDTGVNHTTDVDPPPNTGADGSEGLGPAG